MVSRKHNEQDVAFARLVTNYENHTIMDLANFKAIRESLTAIEAKVDKGSWKTASIGGTTGLIIAIIVSFLTKFGGG